MRPRGYILQIVLPAVKLAELEMTVHQNVLTVRGKRELVIPEGARGIWVGLTGRINLHVDRPH